MSFRKIICFIKLFLIHLILSSRYLKNIFKSGITDLNNKATISGDILHVLNKYSINKGIDINKIYNRIELNFEDNINKNLRIPAEQFQLLWEALLKESYDNNFGLHIALLSSNERKRNDIVFSILSNSTTIEDAIKNLIRYHDISTDLVNVKLEKKNDKAYLSWKSDKFPSIKHDRNYSESIMATFAFLLFYLSDNRIHIREVNFIHSKPENTDEHRIIFKCPVNFNKPRNELIFDGKDLSLQIKYSNSELLGILENYASKLLERLNLNDTYKYSYTEKTTHLINKLLSKGEKPGIKKIARELALSVRSLQNKLKDEEITYQIILDQLRKEISMEYLKKPDAIIYEVAFLLGFSEQSSFNHAFKKWTGSTPKEYQKSNR